MFKLFGSIFVNNDEANKSISKTDSKARGVASTLGKGIKTAAKWGAGILGGATVAAGALMKVASKSAETTDHIDKMSQKIGISRKAYQELDFICSQTGTSVDSLKNGLKTMRSVMDVTAQGTSKTKTALERLGISAVDEKGNLRDSEEVMWETLQTLQSMENQTEKARLASMMFGKAGADLMPMLNGSAKSIEDMKNKAHELGLVLDDETIDNGVKFTDTLDQTKRAASALFTKFGAVFLPILTKLMEGAQKYLPSIANWLQNLTPIFSGFLETMLPPLAEMAKSLFPTLVTLASTLLPIFSDVVNTVMPVFIELIQALLPPLIEIIKTLLPPLGETIKSLLPLFQTAFELIKPILDLVFQLLTPLATLISTAIAPLVSKLASLLNDLLKPIIPIITELATIILETLSPVFEALTPIFNTIFEVLSPIFEIITKLVELVLPAIMPLIKGIANLLGGVLGTAIQSISGAIKGVANILGGLIDFITGVFTGDWKKAWNGIKAIFKGVWDSFYSLIKFPINLIIKGINLLWSGIYTAVKGIVDSIGSVAGALGDIFGQDWHFSMPAEPPLIPELEEGGVLEKGQIGLLEGKGDEAVVPLSKNTEWIDNIAVKLASKLSQSESRSGLTSPDDEDNNSTTVINNYNTFNFEGIDINNDEDIRSFAKKLSAILAELILNQKGAFA